jgi:hypothetical protein
MQVYKEQIALSFDEPWMSQDFGVEHNKTSHITQYHLHVIEGPGIPSEEERDIGAEVGAGEHELVSKPSLAGSDPLRASGVSLPQRMILLAATALLLLFAFKGATTYGSDQRLAAFNFLAAVVCAFVAVRPSRRT